jgi:hypothetical protein
MTAPRPGGPPLLVPAVVFAALTVTGAVLGGSGPRPDSAPAAVLDYTATHTTAMSVAAALLLGSAFPLVVYAATAVRRLRTPVPGPLIGLAGAILAAGSLILSALFSWAAAQTAGLADAGSARLLATLWFATGSAGFTAPLGLFLLGLAVTGLVRRRVPGWLGWIAAAIGIVGLLSTFALITPSLYPLIPIARFGGALALLAFAVVLDSAPAGRTPQPAEVAR